MAIGNKRRIWLLLPPTYVITKRLTWWFCYNLFISFHEKAAFSLYSWTNPHSLRSCVCSTCFLRDWSLPFQVKIWRDNLTQHWGVVDCQVCWLILWLLSCLCDVCSKPPIWYNYRKATDAITRWGLELNQDYVIAVDKNGVQVFGVLTFNSFDHAADQMKKRFIRRMKAKMIIGQHFVSIFFCLFP